MITILVHLELELMRAAMRASKNTSVQKSLAGEPKNEEIDRARLVKAAIRIMDEAMADKEYEIASEALEALARITGHWSTSAGDRAVGVRSSAPPADEEWIDEQPARPKAIRKH
jgi:hypothetical protein